MKFFNILNKQTILFDAAEPWQIGFQDPATPVMEGIINFHHDLAFFLVLIIVFVSYILARCLYFFNEDKHKVAEYSDSYTDTNESIFFDSYMVLEDDLDIGQFRLLEVDNRIVVPTNTHIRMIITASDVLHSWAVPSLGIKLDACPGRLNQTSMFIKREGVFYGQCSEICGINHGFMPIVVEAVSLEDYITWFNKKIESDE